VRNLERELGTVLRKTATRIASAKAQAPVGLDLELVRDALGRQKVFQEAAARTAVPGVATGLAVTGTGGDVLFVEANVMKGTSGGLTLTGQLGDVMKESTRIALTYVRAHAEELGSPRTPSTTASSTCTSPRARSRRTARARASR
jgi:ATP-dependent Lon protease